MSPAGPEYSISDRMGGRRLDVSRSNVAGLTITKALVATFREPPTWQYGYELSEQTGLKSGTLYPILLRLNDQGLLESKWLEPEDLGKPPRHGLILNPDESNISGVPPRTGCVLSLFSMSRSHGRSANLQIVRDSFEILRQ